VEGIVVNSGTYDNYLISENSFSGLMVESIVDAGTSSTARVINNQGYNPVGQSAFVAGASPIDHFEDLMRTIHPRWNRF
jgi:hypothetical protein